MRFVLGVFRSDDCCGGVRGAHHGGDATTQAEGTAPGAPVCDGADHDSTSAHGRMRRVCSAKVPRSLSLEEQVIASKAKRMLYVSEKVSVM